MRPRRSVSCIMPFVVIRLMDLFKEELDVIKSNKLSFVIGFVVLAVIIGDGEYSFVFKEWLAGKDVTISSKDAIIKDKNETIENLKQRLEEAQKNKAQILSPKATPKTVPSRVTGAARTSG